MDTSQQHICVCLHFHFKAIVTPLCAFSSTSCVFQQSGRAKEPGFNKPLTDSSSLRCRLRPWQWLDAGIKSQEMNPAASVSVSLLLCIFSCLPVYSSILHPSLVPFCSLFILFYPCIAFSCGLTSAEWCYDPCQALINTQQPPDCCLPSGFILDPKIAGMLAGYRYARYKSCSEPQSSLNGKILKKKKPRCKTPDYSCLASCRMTFCETLTWIGLVPFCLTNFTLNNILPCDNLLDA